MKSHQKIYPKIPEDNLICIKCQECCKWITFTTAPLPLELKEYYKAKGCKLTYLAPLNPKSQVAVMIRSICPHLTKQGCDIYNKRPTHCRIYDGRQDTLMALRCKLPKQNSKGV